MSMYSWILLTAVGIALGGGYIMLMIQATHQIKRMRAMESQLGIFVDSSIAVAQSVDRLLRQGEVSGKSIASSQYVSSRRWIVQEAKFRLQQGETMLDIAAPLGLSKDEVRLLNAQVH